MAEATLSETLSRHHIDLQLGEVPPRVVQSAKLHILDSLGCLLAGTSFDDRFIESNEVKSLIGKVKVTGEIKLDGYFPQSWPGRVIISLSNGSSHTREIIIPKGEKDNPLSVHKVEEEFLSLAAPVLGDVKARSVIGEVQALADRDSISELIALLRAST